MTHETTVRVRYGEVDRMGVVYHAHYLAYFEQGRTEFLRSLGCAYRAVEDGGLLLVVAEVGMRFRRPAGYDDVLRVVTRLSQVSGVRVRFDYEVDRPSDGVAIAEGFTTLASTDREGRPTRLSDDLKAALDSHLAASPPADGKSGTPRRVQGRVSG